MSTEISSFELFKRLQPKFREITWHANGFDTESAPAVIKGFILRNENLLLAPGYIGQKKPISSIGHSPGGQIYTVWWSDHGIDREDRRPSFQVRQGNLAFTFAFNPSAEEAMQKQLEEAVMQALHTGPFKGRRFFMDPKLDEPTHFRMDYSWRRVNFSIEGDPIQGLHLGVVMARDWTFFIPEGPERLAIKRAIDLESAQVEQEKYHARDPARGIVCELRARFEESLSAIAM